MENKDDVWKGTHISEFQTSLNLSQIPELVNSDEHAVLIQTPITPGKVPDCFPSIFDKIDYWDQYHIKLPCSEKNVTEDQVNRWNLIREALSSVMLSSQQLEAAILSYNKRFAAKWNFATLRAFFDEVCDEEESSMFFSSLLPKIVDLALCLPELITGGVPLLKHGRKYSVTLSQMQIASLLANAFFCTFPHRNSHAKGTEYHNYPTINFTRLFQAVFRDRKKATYEKLRCILHYFRRITSSNPTGVVTYSRNVVPNLLIPNWSESQKTLPRLYVSSEGTIENEGFGLFQVDFAHKLIGGGVIANGCVQEEIRFIICPELILSRLFTECLADNEALIITGCERFSNYNGYGKSFQWAGDYVDETPSDHQGRKYCTVVAIDALFLSRNPKEQFSPSKMNRELNKAYAGFSWGCRRKKEELCGIATGNWGCGVYKGNAQLKSLLQLMAAAESNRDLAYFTFGNDVLRDSMYTVHKFLVANNITVGKIYSLLCQYNALAFYEHTTVFDYIRDEAISDNVPEKANENLNSVATKVVKPLSMLKIAETKPSLCFRTKKADKKETPKRDKPSTSRNSDDTYPLEAETVQPRKVVDDAETRNLKKKETQQLLMMYASAPSTSKIEDSSDSFDFDMYAKKKNSQTKRTKRTSEGESDYENQIPSTLKNDEMESSSDKELEKISSTDSSTEREYESFDLKENREIKRKCIDTVRRNDTDNMDEPLLNTQVQNSNAVVSDENASSELKVEHCSAPKKILEQDSQEECDSTDKVEKPIIKTPTPGKSRSVPLEGLTFSKRKMKKKDNSKKKIQKQQNTIVNYFSPSQQSL